MASISTTEPATPATVVSPPRQSDRRVWRKRTMVALVVVAYAALWGATGLANINATDFDVFFLPSAIIAAAGHPLHIYAVRYMTTYPNANGPLAMAPLALVAWIAGHLGWLANRPLRRALAMAIFSIFSLLMAREAVLASDRLLARPLRGWSRFLGYALFALSPELWHSVLFYGHLEQPLMLWLILAGTRALVERRAGRAGALVGLALLTRSEAVLYLAPLALLLLRRRRWRAARWLVGVAGATLTVGLLPFWLADRADMWYSLVSFRNTLPIGGGSIWRLAFNTSWSHLATQYDSAAVLLAAGIVCVVALAPRPDVDVDSRGVYALFGACSLCFLLLMRTLWPYYFLDTYVFLAVWWLTALPQGRGRWALARWWAGAALPALLIGYAQFGEYEVSHVGNAPWSVRSSLFMAGLLTVTLAGVIVLMWRGEISSPPDPASVLIPLAPREGQGS
ncbi:MAG TPA: hypothetical protein VJN88_07645 [Ktedonobacterales bacterium]|nr:hypothetical protein [Ktedonobacterales bacterium]